MRTTEIYLRDWAYSGPDEYLWKIKESGPANDMYPGERIVLSMRKAEVLLAYLALAPGIRHPR